MSVFWSAEAAPSLVPATLQVTDRSNIGPNAISSRLMIYRSDRDGSALTKRNDAMDSGFGAATGDSTVAFKSASVAVTFKRRRVASPPFGNQDPAREIPDRPDAGNRPGRVFKIGTAAQRDAPSAVLVGPGAVEAVEQVGPRLGVGPARRRRDATRAPGEVVRIVFEGSSGTTSPAEEADSRSPEPDRPFYNGQHELILKALDDVRATLRAAQDANRFRIT